jgi:haloalkane dehalogenase
MKKRRDKEPPPTSTSPGAVTEPPGTDLPGTDLPGTDAIPSWVPRDLFPFESRFITLEENTLHYVDEGQGPTLLLLHGNPTWSFLYREIIEGLRSRFRCVALDYPGFGLSRAAPGYDFLPASHARVVEAFVDALALGEGAGLTPMVQDWAGPIGLWVASRRPAQVRGLIIGNTWAWPINGDPHFERFSKLMGGRVGRFAIRHLNAFVNLVLPKGVTRHKLDRRVMAAYRAPFATRDSRRPTHVFPREIRLSRDFLAEVESGLGPLADKPALILWGDRDIAFRARERQRFEQTFPRHRTVELPGAGHFIQEDAPEEIVAAIERWWDEAFS